MIKFKFQKPELTRATRKATVHKSGKLGFSSGAAKMMEFEVNTYYRIATNAEDINDKNLYLMVGDKDTNDVFHVAKAGSYYYIRVKSLLEKLGVDYLNEKVTYDIKMVKDSEGDLTYFKLERRS
jgi:hypothetical protein